MKKAIPVLFPFCEITSELFEATENARKHLSVLRASRVNNFNLIGAILAVWFMAIPQENSIA